MIAQTYMQPHQMAQYREWIAIVRQYYTDVNADLKLPVTYRCCKCRDIGAMYRPVPDGDTFKIVVIPCPSCGSRTNGN